MLSIDVATCRHVHVVQHVRGEGGGSVAEGAHGAVAVAARVAGLGHAGAGVGALGGSS